MVGRMCLSIPQAETRDECVAIKEEWIGKMRANTGDTDQREKA